MEVAITMFPLLMILTMVHHTIAGLTSITTPIWTGENTQHIHFVLSTGRVRTLQTHGSHFHLAALAHPI